MGRRRTCQTCGLKFRIKQLEEHLARDHPQQAAEQQKEHTPLAPAAATEPTVEETASQLATAPVPLTKEELKETTEKAIKKIYPLMLQETPRAAIEQALKMNFQRMNWVARHVLIDTAAWMIQKHREVVAEIDVMCLPATATGSRRSDSSSSSSRSSSVSTRRSRSRSRLSPAKECVDQSQLEFAELTKEEDLETMSCLGPSQAEVRKEEPPSKEKETTPKETPLKDPGRRKSSAILVTPSRELIPPAEKQRREMGLPDPSPTRQEKQKSEKSPARSSEAAGTVSSPSTHQDKPLPPEAVSSKKGSLDKHQRDRPRRSRSRSPARGRLCTPDRPRSRRRSPDRDRTLSIRGRTPTRRTSEERHPSSPTDRGFRIPRRERPTRRQLEQMYYQWWSHQQRP